MDYRKQCESRLMEASMGAHKLTQRINPWPKVPILNEQSKDFEGSFDLQQSLITLKNLQEATRMMSRVRQNLELDLEHEEHGFVSTRSSNCIEELKKVARESVYSRNFSPVSTDDKWGLSSRLSRFSTNSEDSVQPKRTKSSNLVAKLMGLESVPSDIGRKCLLRSDKPSSIETLKARMLRLTEKTPQCVVSENEAIEDHKNMLHSSSYNRNFFIYEDIPPVVILKTRESQAEVDKICDRKKVPVTDAEIPLRKSERKEVKRCQKPERKPLQNRKQQEQMSRFTQKRENGTRNPPMRESKAVVKVKKAIPAPISQPKLSNKRLVTTNTKLDSQDSIDDLKKKRETKPARKSMDIIQVIGNATHNEVRGINGSRRRALPCDERPKSKQCSRGHRRKDLKLFRESESNHFLHGKILARRTGKAEEGIKLLLSSSRSFINCVQQLCGRGDHYQTTYHPTKCIGRDAKLLLGCAKELVFRKSRQLERSNHPITSTRLSSSTSVDVSVDQLVEEIANEVAKLRARCEVGKGLSSRDVVRAMAEGDVLMNAMWDEGWQEWICVEEADCVVGTLEKLILCGLVEELVLDFKGVIV